MPDTKPNHDDLPDTDAPDSDIETCPYCGGIGRGACKTTSCPGPAGNDDAEQLRAKLERVLDATIRKGGLTLHRAAAAALAARLPLVEVHERKQVDVHDLVLNGYHLTLRHDRFFGGGTVSAQTTVVRALQNRINEMQQPVALEHEIADQVAA